MKYDLEKERKSIKKDMSKHRILINGKSSILEPISNVFSSNPDPALYSSMYVDCSLKVRYLSYCLIYSGDKIEIE